jgi:hypothetical protein
MPQRCRCGIGAAGKSVSAAFARRQACAKCGLASRRPFEKSRKITGDRIHITVTGKYRDNSCPRRRARMHNLEKS